MMTPVSSVNRRPLCDAKFADEARKPPVCSHTITGAGVDGSGLRTQMFSLRQSSLPPTVVPLMFGHPGGVAVARMVVVEGVGGSGGVQRRAAVGGAAYGMP